MNANSNSNSIDETAIGWPNASASRRFKGIQAMQRRALRHQGVVSIAFLMSSRPHTMQYCIGPMKKIDIASSVLPDPPDVKPQRSIRRGSR